MSIQYTADQLQRKFSGPTGSSGFARLGEGLRTEGRLDEAIQICQDGLRLRPTHLTGHLVLGKSLIDAGRTDDAREQFEAALRLDSRCLSAMRHLADIMNLLKMGEVAAGYYRSILEVEPWDLEIQALLGNVPTPSQDYAPPVSAANESEDTYHKPDGYTSDVMEINLNEISDFLPSQDADMLLVPASDGPSIEPAPESEVVAPIEAASSQVSEDAIPEVALVPTPEIEEHSDETASIPISGLDVEDRLDSLFGSQEATPESVIDDVQSFTATEMIEVSASGEATAFQPNDFTGPVAGSPVTDQDRVLGEDIEKRLDDLFSLSDEEKSPPTHTAALTVELPDLSVPDTGEFRLDDLALAKETSGAERPEDFLAENLETTASSNDSIMSTESMLPVGWLADAGEHPPVTGADIEAQLDKLFDLDETPDTFQPQTRDADNRQELPIQEEPFLSQGKGEDFTDQTLTFPTLKNSESEMPVTDWRASQGQNEPRPPVSKADPMMGAEETMMMPMAEMDRLSDLDMAPDFDATLEISVPGPTLAPEDSSSLPSSEADALTETTSMEMVDGSDIASRLDELFTEDAAKIETMGTETMAIETMAIETSGMEAIATGTTETSDSETIVTGEEVASRLSEIFEEPENAPSGLKMATSSPEPDLAPLTDEEDAYPEEEESASQTEGGANVATVTLAEIYFQQGLREQALQIYRQLLELEPGNDSVRTRISEIEASKPDGENQGSGGQGPGSQRPGSQGLGGQPDGQGPDSHPRRPRPGFKIPKRKK